MSSAPLEDITGSVQSGMYKHFKGNRYEVLFCARHSEDLSVMVIYRSLVDNQVWSRPLEEFNKLLPDGSKRFAFLGWAPPIFGELLWMKKIQKNETS